MAKNATAFVEDFAFYEQLWYYYETNRGKIRSRYNDLTKKFLAYNDKNENPDAFLRQPQFEALEMYVFIKEFIDNEHMYVMFDKWRKHEDYFSDASYYSIHKDGQDQIDHHSEGQETPGAEMDTIYCLSGQDNITIPLKNCPTVFLTTGHSGRNYYIVYIYPSKSQSISIFINSLYPINFCHERFQKDFTFHFFFCVKINNLMPKLYLL